jgi:hypothetical protein
LAEPQRWNRHWTREGRDPLAGFAMGDDGLAEWSATQTTAWRSLAQENESIPGTIRRIAQNAATLCLAKGWVEDADAGALIDEIIYGLARGAFVWNALRPSVTESTPLSFYEASLRLGDRLMREALEKKDEAEARRLGVPNDAIARALSGQLPPPLEAPKTEGDEIRRRGWMRVVLRPASDASVAFVNPSPWAEPVSGGYDLPSFRHAARLAAMIAAAHGDDARIALSNAAGALLALGLPFDSPRGLGVTASLIAMLHSVAGEMSRLLGLGSSSANHQVRDAYLQFPDASRPQAGRLEPMRWREAALAALDQPDPWNGIDVTGESDPASESLTGAAAPGLGAVKSLSNADGQAGLRAIGYDQTQLAQALLSIELDESPDFLSEEQAQVLRGMMPEPWGQVHPQAQIRRALDLAPLFRPPIDAVVGADSITPELRALAIESAERGGAASVIIFGRPIPTPSTALTQEPSYESPASEPRRLSLCRSDDGTIGFQAPGASANELALIQTILSLAQVDPNAALERLPEDDSLAGQLRRQLQHLV